MFTLSFLSEFSVSLFRINNDVQHFRILRSPERHQYFLWNNSPHFNNVNALVTHYRSSPVGKTGSAVLRDANFVSMQVFCAGILSLLRQSCQGWKNYDLKKKKIRFFLLLNLILFFKKSYFRIFQFIFCCKASIC